MALSKKEPSLTERVANLESQVKGLLKLLEAKGIDYPWLPVSQAAPLLGVSAEFIRREIRDSQGDPRNSDYKIGTHYRYKSRSGSARPTWLINVEKFAEVLSIPLEKRKVEGII